MKLTVAPLTLEQSESPGRPPDAEVAQFPQSREVSTLDSGQGDVTNKRPRFRQRHNGFERGIDRIDQSDETRITCKQPNYGVRLALRERGHGFDRNRGRLHLNTGQGALDLWQPRCAHLTDETQRHMQILGNHRSLHTPGKERGHVLANSALRVVIRRYRYEQTHQNRDGFCR